MDLAFPLTVLSDLHVGHPATYIRDPVSLAPLFRESATVVFNGDTVEMLWLCNRDHAQEQMEHLAAACLDQGARPLFLNGNHDVVISSASHLDLCEGAVLVTHGDILFHEIAPWSREAKILSPEHARALEALGAAAHSDFEQRLIAAKKASLSLELHEPKRPGGRGAGIKTALRECWPPWQFLRILRCWAQTPGRADRLAAQFRPQARFVLIGHTHYSGIWNRGRRVVINTGSFLPYSGRCAVRIDANSLQVRQIVHVKNEWHYGRTLATFPIEKLQPIEG